MSKTEIFLKKLLPLLHGNGLTRAEMQTKLGVDNRTITRYLNDLTDLGYRLHKDGTFRTRYSIQQKEAPLSDSDVALLAFLESKHEKQGDYTMVSAITKLKEKIQKLYRTEATHIPPLADSANFMELNNPNSSRKLTHTIGKALNKAIKERSIIEVTYSWEYNRQPLNCPYTFKYHPYGISNRNGRLYCVGKCEIAKTIIPLYIGNIQRIVSSGTNYKEIPPSLQEIYKYSFGAFIHDKGLKIRIQINTESLEKYLYTTIIHTSARMIKIKGITVLELKVGIDSDLINWIVGYGNELTVLSPDKLVRNVTNDISSNLPLFSRRQNPAT